jgi:hypothetical protein
VKIVIISFSSVYILFCFAEVGVAAVAGVAAAVAAVAEVVVEVAVVDDDSLVARRCLWLLLVYFSLAHSKTPTNILHI